MASQPHNLVSKQLQYTYFFSMWVFFHEHSRITGLQRKRGRGGGGGGCGGIFLTPHYHFHPVHRQLDISRTITAESSPLHIASSRTRTGNLWFHVRKLLTTKLLTQYLKMYRQAGSEIWSVNRIYHEEQFC